MAFRIGVHLGDVIEKSDGTVYGDGVNIASRLQALAKPGSTVVSQAIRDAVRARTGMVFLDLGEHSAKNISEPVRAFQCATASSETEVSKTAPTAESPANRPSANTRAKRPMLATSMAFLIMAT